MSRSRKKTPIATCAKNKKGKKEASKKIRKIDDIGNGNNYKKHYNSWNICDYKCWIKNVKEWWKELCK